jgi:hypothetical protein
MGAVITSFFLSIPQICRFRHLETLSLSRTHVADVSLDGEDAEEELLAFASTLRKACGARAAGYLEACQMCAGPPGCTLSVQWFGLALAVINVSFFGSIQVFNLHPLKSSWPVYNDFSGVRIPKTRALNG